jgi:hypothetical protein
MKRPILCFFLFTLLTFSALAQERTGVPPRPQAPGLAYAQARYDSATVESPHLYNGPQYYFYDSKSEEHQFFLTEEWQTGSVLYDGQLFSGVPLLYDIFKDQLVVRYTRGVGSVALQSEKVYSFTFDGHNFVRILAGQPEAYGLRTGFYDVLYEGKTRLLSRRVKERLQQISETKITIEFPPRDVFYLLKDGQYQAVHSKASVLSLLEDQKKPLKKYFRQNKLSFRENREQAIKALATHYDQLSQP